MEPQQSESVKDSASLHSHSSTSEHSFKSPVSIHASDYEEPIKRYDPNPNNLNASTSVSVETQSSSNANNGTNAPEFVPRKDRRGLFSLVCLIPERVNPLDYETSTKYCLLSIISFAAVVGPMGGSVFLPAIDDVESSLHSTKSIVNISYGIYVLSLAIFPIWWSSFSEQFGRRSTYIISFSAYFCFLIGCSLVKTIGALMVCRFLAGGCAASVQAVGAGTLSDIFVPTQRGRAMGYFYLGPLLGPLVGPIFGGLIAERWGWRGTQWFLVIISGVIFALVVLFVPETLLKRGSSSQKNASSEQAVSEKSTSNPSVPNGANNLSIPQDGVPNTDNSWGRSPSVSSTKIEKSQQYQRSIRACRHSLSKQMSYLTTDDLDNTNVGDSFVPIIPAPSHTPETDAVWANAISQYNENNPNDQILNEEAVDENDIDKFNKALKETGQHTRNLQYKSDIESQIDTLQAIEKMKTTASEKERRLMSASAQVDFNSLDLKQKLFWLFVRPLKSFKFFTYPPVALTIIYGSIVFSTLYFLNIGLEALYSAPPYNFSSVFVGLTYIPNSVGYVISTILSGRYSDKVVRREKALLGYFNAESRFAEHFYMAMFIYPCSLVMFGWTAYYKLHWMIPLVATFFFGLSSMVVMGTAATYLVDALPGRGSSGIAINNFVRFSLAAISTFINAPMAKGMGYGWMYTFLAILAGVSSVLIFAIKIWGTKWRSEANFEKMYR